ncbi:phage holin family protein [Lacrimispora sp.]|uniref:phage holin family protein n=1 Tax=Lacrimispora sp. TaxID=2719234 RepID=UPI002866CC6C|nr:phage holin family protein [Lacrimispora sp.]MDR7814899.1 phage holin family protein [Lacrimispora sp.]
MRMKKDILCTGLGIAATIGTKMFGGWTPTLNIVIIMMGLDLFAGFMVAAAFNNSPKSESGAADSKAMFRGICKKIMMLCLLAVAHQIDLVLGVDYIMLATTYGFITNEALSIVENAGLMGIVKSEVLTNAIELLKSKGNKSE